MIRRDALLRLSQLSRQARQTTCWRCLYSTSPIRRDAAASPTDAPASPVLSRLRQDLKTAMRAKDTARLSVLRMVLAEITNASKTQAPIKDDLTLLTLLKKRIVASKNAISEFYEADRKDLVVKEQEQLGMLEEYAGGIKTMDIKEIGDLIAKVIEAVKADGRKLTMGDVMKRAMAPEGPFQGKMVEKSEVVRVIKSALEQPST